MHYRASHEVFDPGDYDPVFKFELDLGFSDYLLLLCYLIFIAPLELLGWALKRGYQSLAGMLESLRLRADSSPQHGLLSVLTKYF